MKKIEVYEFQDLPVLIQEKVKNQYIQDEIEFHLDCLSFELEKEVITEDEYWDIIGCSKNYGESTPWFLPSVYYEKNQKEVDDQVKDYLKDNIFDKFGTTIFI